MKFFLFFLMAAGFLSAEEEDGILSQTLHTIELDSGPITYTATVGSLPVREFKKDAQIFYIAYQQVNVGPHHSPRPITFAFNGGPGCASVPLHLGAFGPKRVPSPEEGQSIAPPYHWIDNEDSILDLTDLVFIDPIGTGFSRAEDDSEAGQAYSTLGDIQVISNFIHDYITQNGRWNSPKYLAGESYGTMRAAGLADDLQSRHSLYLNGLILVSCAMDYSTLVFELDNQLPYVLFLPTYAATAWYHGRVDKSVPLSDVLENARHFAIDTYAPTLFSQGTISPSLYEEIAHWTGLPLDLVRRRDGLIDDETYAIELFGPMKKVIGRFDSRYMGDILPPYRIFEYADPSATQISGMYGAALKSYLFEELECRLDWPRYEFFSPDSHFQWNFNSSFGYPSTMQNLRHALVANPELRIFAACGYFDLATPFAATEYCFKRLHVPRKENIEFGYYEGGHMFYVNPQALRQFKNDLKKFIR